MSSNIILESPILQEAVVTKHDPTRCRFSCTIQTCDDINKNKRMYPRAVMEQGMEDNRDKMNAKSFYGELDHPLPSASGGSSYDSIRQTTVLLKEVSHYIMDYEWRGNKLIAHMETATTPNGKTAFALIRDKSTVGFSMRGLAELEQKKDYSVVKPPLSIISFDLVSQPSHSSAIVNFNEMIFESESFVNKNNQIITEMENINEGESTICFNGQCYLTEYFDKLVEMKTIQFFNRWI